MSKSRENAGLNSQPKHYGKNPIPSRARALNAKEILPGDGKIFTALVPKAEALSTTPHLSCLIVALLLHYRGKS